MRRRLLLILGGLVAFVTVVVLGGLLVLQTDWAKDHLRRLALTRTAQLLNGQLSIGRLGGSLFYGVVLDEVSIVQAGVTVLDAERIEVRYDPLMLWRQGLVFSELVIHHPRINVVQNAAGWNIENLLKPPARPDSPPVHFSIAHLGVIGATVNIHPNGGRPRTLNDVSLDAELSRAADGVAMTIARLTGHDDLSGTDLNQFSGTFARSFADLDASFDLSNHQSRASGQVRAHTGPAGRDLTGAVDLTEFDLSTVLSDDRWASDITGHATLRGQLPSSAAPTAVTFTFAGPRAAAWGYEGQNLDLSGLLSDGLLKFAGKARAYRADVTVDANWRFSAIAGNPPARFAGTGTFARVQLAQLPAQFGLPHFDTNLAGRYAIEVDADGWGADTTLQRSLLEGAVLGTGTTGHVEMRHGRLRYRANGVVAELDVNRLAGPLDLPILAERRFGGRINGPFSVEGSGTKPADRQMTAQATVSDSTLGDTRLPRVALGVELAGPRLAIHATGDFETLTAETAGLPTTLTMDLSGTTDVQVDIHDVHAAFSPDSVDVSGQLALRPSTIQGVPVKSATIDAALVDGMATIHAFSADLVGAHLNADGCVALGSTGDSALNVSASVDDLRPIGDAIGRPLTGAVDLAVEVSGSADHPRARGTMNGRSLTYGTTASALTLATTFNVDMPGRDIASLTGRGDVDGTFLQAAGFEITRIGGSAAYEQRRLTVDTHLEDASRTLELAGVIGLEPEHRDVTLERLKVATGAVVWTLPAGEPARIGIDADRLVISNLTFVRDAQRIDIEGDLPLGSSPIASETPLGVRVQQVRLSDINQMILGRRTLDGLLNGSLTLNGSISAPVIAGDVSIVNGTVENVHFDSARAKVQYSGAIATIDATLDQTADRHFTIAGTVPISAPGLDVRVTSTPIDLAFIEAFTTEVTRVTGTGVFDVTLTGALSAPVLDGTVDLDQGAFVLDATGVAYRDLSARLRFERNHLQVASLSIADSDGHELRAAGGLDVIGSGDERTVDLQVTATGFHVINNKFGNLQVDADLRVDGDLLAPRLRGNLRIDGGRIEVDRVLEVTTKSVYSTRPQVAEDAVPIEGLPPAAEPKPAATVPSEGLASRVDLAVNLELPDNLVLRGRDLRADGSSIGLGDMNIIAGGTLTLEKQRGSAVTMVGSLEVIRGFYSFQGRRFDVERGSRVRFRGLVPIDPALDVTATREISGVNASVHLKGTLREPVVALTSQPPLDEADVLSLIVFGQPVNGLAGSQRTSLTDRFTSMAAGTLATPLADSVARALNLDLFEIQTPSGGSNAPVVSLGSQIGSRLYVGLKQEVGGADEGSVSIEYRLGDFLRLVTSLARGTAERRGDRRNEEHGIDLIYLLRY